MFSSHKETHTLLSIDDFILFAVLLLSISVMFFLWLVTNTIGIHTLGGGSFVLVLSLLFVTTVVFLILRSGISISKMKTLPLTIFFIFLIIASFFYIVYPAISHPFASIGIPNKDVHDGIAVYIADYGATPSNLFKTQAAFIMNAHEGLYLDYPNVIHTVSGLLITLGVSIFSATWIIYALMLSLASCGVLLIFHLMDKNDILSTVLAGLFPIISFRIWYAGVASIPMAFSLALLIVVLALWLFLVKHKHIANRFLVFGISGALLAASYSGTIWVLFGFMAILFVLSKILHAQIDYSHLRKDLLFALPIIVIGFLLQGKIYWQNTFPTSVDFDPFELSQRLMPIDDILYMGLFLILSGVSIFQLIRRQTRQQSQKTDVFEWSFVIISLGLLGFIIYDVVFHIRLGSFSPEDLIKSPTNGIWSGLNHQKISRLAFLQPFFWIFCMHFPVNNQYWRRAVALTVGALIVYHAITSIITFPYNPIQKELYDSFYNNKEKILFFDTLSTGKMRLVYNPYIWDSGVIKELNELKKFSAGVEKVYFIDGRIWTEETVADWASIYIRKPVLRLSQEAIKSNKSVIIWGHGLTENQYILYSQNCGQYTYKDSSSFICAP